MLTHPNLLLIVGAVHSAAFALFHLCFWRLFDWRRTLEPLSPVNRGVMQVLNLCLTLGFAAAAVIVFCDRTEILQTQLGAHVLLALAVFWAARLVEQFIFFPVRRRISVALIVLFALGTAVYALAFLSVARRAPSSLMSTQHHESHIDYVELPASAPGALRAAKVFYTGVFGWKYQDWGEQYADTGSSGVMSGLNGDPAQRLAAPLAVLYTEQLEKTRDKVVAAGGRISRDIFAFPGGRRFHFIDPAGNELGVWSDK
jgi:predicted enzyme related to lactoylglutathione lyase